MGFFSSIARVIGGVARTFLGIGAPAVATVATRGPISVARAGLTAIGRAAVSPAGQIGIGVGGGIIGGALLTPGAPSGIVPVTPGAQVMGQIGRGNGQFARQTIVQTIELATGNVVRQEVFSGAPFLMQKAVRELRATTKKLSRAHARIPRRTRMQSKNAQLVNAVLDRALSQVAACPTTSHG